MNAIEGAFGVIKSGSKTSWATWNVMFSKPSRKGKEFRGGSKKQRDNWYGYNDKDFQNWWHRQGKAEFRHDIEDSEMAKEVYDYWVDLGKPKVK